MEINSDIPVPAMRVSRKILGGMKVGDSVIVDKTTANTLRNGAYFLFMRTRQKKQSSGQIRVWRIK